MTEKSSRKAALEKLGRSQLIEIIFTLQQHERNLVRERDSLKQLLASQGPSNGNAPSMPGIVEHAQQAAEKCLESVRDMNEKAQEANNQIIEAAERQAAAILQDAELQAQHILNLANVKFRELEASSQVLPEDFDMLLDDIDESLISDEAYSVPQAQDYLDNVESEYPVDYQPKLPYEAQFIEELAQLSDAELEEELADTTAELQGDDLLEELHIRPEDVQAPTVMITIGEEETWETPELEEKEEGPKPLSPDLISNFDPLADPDAFLSDYKAALEGLLGSDGAEEASQRELASYLDAIASEEELQAIAEDPDARVQANAAVETPSLNQSDIEKIHAKAESKSAVEGSGVSKEATEADVSGDDERAVEENSDIQVTTEMTPVSSTQKTMGEVASYAQSATSIGATEPFEPLDPSISGLLSMTKAERKAAKKAAKKARKAAKRSGNPRLEKMNAEKALKESEAASPSDAASSDLQDTGEAEPVKAEEVAAEAVVADEVNKSAKAAQTQEQLMDHARQMLKTTAVPEIMQSSYESFTNANRIEESAYSALDDDAYLDDADEYQEHSGSGQEKQGVE